MARQVQAVVGDEVMVFEYEPDASDAAYEAGRRYMDGHQQVDVAAMLAGLIVSWDVVDDADRPVPVAASTIETFPVWWIDALVAAIMADIRDRERRN